MTYTFAIHTIPIFAALFILIIIGTILLLFRESARDLLPLFVIDAIIGVFVVPLTIGLVLFNDKKAETKNSEYVFTKEDISYNPYDGNVYISDKTSNTVVKFDFDDLSDHIQFVESEKDMRAERSVYEYSYIEEKECSLYITEKTFNDVIRSKW